VAKATRKERARRAAREDRLPLEPLNFKIMGAGVVLIILGYLALAEGSVEGSFPLTVAPVLLVLGYCVVLPLGIIYRKGLFARKQRTATTAEQGS